MPSHQPLTPSGLGARLAAPGGVADPDAVRETALTTGLALVPEVRMDEDGFRRFVAALGNPVVYDDEQASVGYGFADVLHLDGTAEDGKVITGRGGLPLHTDGILLGTQVDLIILYAAKIGDLGSNGRTIVCDQLAAWRDLPDRLARVIDTGALEYRALERGYFTSVPEGWYPISTTRDYGRVRSLNLALPFPADDDKSWEVRVPGVAPADSDRFFADLAAFLSRPEYLYAHTWREGDLLVIDNQRTLHGRMGLAEESTRKLLRGQITLVECS